MRLALPCLILDLRTMKRLVVSTSSGAASRYRSSVLKRLHKVVPKPSAVVKGAIFKDVQKSRYKVTFGRGIQKTFSKKACGGTWGSALSAARAFLKERRERDSREKCSTLTPGQSGDAKRPRLITVRQNMTCGSPSRCGLVRLTDQSRLALYGRPGTTDHLPIEEVYVKKVYQFGPYTVSDLTKFLDVGSHIGSCLAYACGSGAVEVTCVEMDAANFSLLLRNAIGVKKAHPESTIRLLCAAAVGSGTAREIVVLSRGTGAPRRRISGEMLLDTYRGRCSGLGGGQDQPVGTAPTITLPALRALVATHHCIGKIDIEGAEILLNYGIGSPPCIILEVHKKEATTKTSLKKFEQLLVQSGYKIHRVLNKDFWHDLLVWAARPLRGEELRCKDCQQRWKALSQCRYSHVHLV